MSFRLLPEEANTDELVCSDKTLAIDGSNLVIKVVSPVLESQSSHLGSSTDEGEDEPSKVSLGNSG